MNDNVYYCKYCSKEWFIPTCKNCGRENVNTGYSYGVWKNFMPNQKTQIINGLVGRRYSELMNKADELIKIQKLVNEGLVAQTELLQKKDAFIRTVLDGQY